MIGGFLRWVDVDPRTRPRFDPDRATAIVRPLVAAAATARGPRFRDLLAESIQRELTRGGYALHVAEPVFIVSRTAFDRQLGASLARVLQRLIGPIA